MEFNATSFDPFDNSDEYNIDVCDLEIKNQPTEQTIVGKVVFNPKKSSVYFKIDSLPKDKEREALDMMDAGVPLKDVLDKFGITGSDIARINKKK